MKKAILLSVQSKPLCNILNKIKIEEIRKSVPQCELPIDVFLYCTKANPILGYEFVNGDVSGYCYSTFDNIEDFDGLEYLCNGKVVAKFTLNKISKANFDTAQFNPNLLKNTCLTEKELIDYLGERHLRSWRDFYVWQIDGLVIFDEPIELREFYANVDKKDNMQKTGLDLQNNIFKIDGHWYSKLSNAPQSYQFVWVKE